MCSLSKEQSILSKETIQNAFFFFRFMPFFDFDLWVPHGSVVKCLTHNPGVLGLSLTGSSGFFRGSVLGQDTSEPSLVLVKPRKA